MATKETTTGWSAAGAPSLTRSYSAGRIALFNRLLKRRADVATGAFWTPPPASLRFRLGETIRELKVPYHMGTEDEAVVENALIALAELLKKRMEPPEKGSRDTSISLSAGPALKEKTFRTDIIAGDLEKGLASEILLAAPYSDSAMLSIWLGQDGAGKRLLKWADALLEKALKDEARHGTDESTAYLALLAVIGTIRKKKERLKDFRVKGMSYDRFDLAIGMPVFMALKGSLTALFTRLLSESAVGYNQTTEALVMSALVPAPFLSIPSNLLSASMNPYGMSREAFDVIAPFAPAIDKETKDLSILVNAATQKIKEDPDAMSACKPHYDNARFREEAHRYVLEFDVPGSNAQNVIYEAYGDDNLIRNLLANPKGVQTLSASIDEVKVKYAKDARRREIADSFQGFLSAFKKKRFGGFLSGSKREPFDGLDSMLRAYYARGVDEFIEKNSSRMRAALEDKRKELRADFLLDEYSRGQLYRFSVDDRPILKTLEAAEEGQLFIDMKDFTKKTLKVKELAMAEFMKDNFYRPILSAAKNYRIGTGVTLDERGIWLTNLLGDAAVFSGGVSYLVALARDVQKILRRYRDELSKKLPEDELRELLKEVHAKFERHKTGVAEQKRRLEEAVSKGEAGAKAKLLQLIEEGRHLENSYRDEIEEAVRGELAAGLFISYGAKAKTLSLEGSEFGASVQVAIGEKINEASRGTGRNALVRAKLEVILEQERLKRKDANLAYPFDVYIDRAYSVKMPHEIEKAFEKLIVSKNVASGQAIAKLMVVEFLEDIKKVVRGEAFSTLRLITGVTDIYNGGQALSYNALKAYMNESRSEKFFFDKVVRVGELDAGIQKKFFFPEDKLELWCGARPTKEGPIIEIFRKAGEVTFKGFEADKPTVVYEMLSEGGDLFHAIADKHFEAWFNEARQGGRQ